MLDLPTPDLPSNTTLTCLEFCIYHRNYLPTFNEAPRLLPSLSCCPLPSSLQPAPHPITTAFYYFQQFSLFLGYTPSMVLRAPLSKYL
mmetsp:Transcript_18247/g.32742  ORF Transcript_18247/g.32742 Transcript_18247/m.32742 type:complete len:88 (+) Transcript_18247:611-874(+)